MEKLLFTYWPVIKPAMDVFVFATGLFALGVLVAKIRDSYVRTR